MTEEDNQVGTKKYNEPEATHSKEGKVDLLVDYLSQPSRAVIIFAKLAKVPSRIIVTPLIKLVVADKKFLRAYKKINPAAHCPGHQRR